MKHLLLPALLLLGFRSHAQAPALGWQEQAYYETAEEVRGFASLADTANASAAILLAKGAKVFVTSFPSPGWAQCTRAGGRYIIPVSALSSPDAPADKPVPGRYLGSGLLTGPRGGVYRVNSSGNKTYLKH